MAAGLLGERRRRRRGGHDDHREGKRAPDHIEPDADATWNERATAHTTIQKPLSPNAKRTSWRGVIGSAT
jgi:hypothetical protein